MKFTEVPVGTTAAMTARPLPPFWVLSARTPPEFEPAVILKVVRPWE